MSTAERLVDDRARVVARTANGHAHGVGQVIAAWSCPTVLVERDNGEQFPWAAHLVERTADTAPPALVLRRHWTANLRPVSAAEQLAAGRSETVAGHPPIPPAALPHLARHLGGLPARWHHLGFHPWDAVTDLHRAGDHATAGQLAAVLVWCEQHGQRADCTVWEIVEPAGDGR